MAALGFALLVLVWIISQMSLPYSNGKRDFWLGVAALTGISLLTLSVEMLLWRNLP